MAADTVAAFATTALDRLRHLVYISVDWSKLRGEEG